MHQAVIRRADQPVAQRQALAEPGLEPGGIDRGGLSVVQPVVERTSLGATVSGEGGEQTKTLEFVSDGVDGVLGGGAPVFGEGELAGGVVELRGSLGGLTVEDVLVCCDHPAELGIDRPRVVDGGHRGVGDAGQGGSDLVVGVGRVGETATEVSATSSITVSFSDPMDRPDVEDRFAITPSVDGELTWDGGDLVFTPAARLAAGNRYTISVIGAPENGDGLVMEYFDSRGVRRTYGISLADGVLRIWRDAPGFDQRYSATLAPDTFEGQFQLAETPGDWRGDLRVIYRRRA